MCVEVKECFSRLEARRKGRDERMKERKNERKKEKKKEDRGQKDRGQRFRARVKSKAAFLLSVFFLVSLLDRRPFLRTFRNDDQPRRTRRKRRKRGGQKTVKGKEKGCTVAHMSNELMLNEKDGKKGAHFYVEETNPSSVAPSTEKLITFGSKY